MLKEIKFENGFLIIDYCDNSQDITVYESGEYTEPIKFTFIPNTKMTERECLKYTNENKHKIIEEAKIVITENFEFYKNFEIDFNSQFLGYSLHKTKLNTDLLIVSESWMRLKCKLKEKKLH